MCVCVSSSNATKKKVCVISTGQPLNGTKNSKKKVKMDATLPRSNETPQKPDYKPNEEYKDIIRKIAIGHKRLDKFLCKRFPVLLRIQKKFNVPTSVVSYSASILALWFAKYIFGARFLTNSIAASFPIYCTQVIVMGKQKSDALSQNEESMKRLLSFWLYFGVSSLLETFCERIFRGRLANSSWIRFYYPVKLALFVSMWFPESRVTKRFGFVRNFLEMKFKDSQALIEKLPDKMNSTMKQASSMLSGGQKKQAASSPMKQVGQDVRV